MKPSQQAKRASRRRLRNWQSFCYQLYSSQAQTFMKPGTNENQTDR